MPKSSFICKNCHKKVSLKAPGTRNRNHCQYCLYSLHVDKDIGDRKSGCLGLMKPIARMYKKDGEEVLVHQCEKCGEIRKNRVAGDDNYELLAQLKEIDYF